MAATVVVVVIMCFVGPNLLKSFIPTNLFKNVTNVYRYVVRITTYDYVLVSTY